MEIYMSLVNLVLIIICPTIGINLDRSKTTLYRSDGRCGISFPTKEGTLSECDPMNQADGRGPCCSSSSWCGGSEDHCKCEGCVDYRTHDYKEPLPVTMSPFKQLSNLLSSVSGDKLEEYRDGKYDAEISDPTAVPNLPSPSQTRQNALPTTQSPSVCLPCPCLEQTETRDRRTIPGVILEGIPFLTTFAGKLIKNILHQLINRPGPVEYTDTVLKRFVPRALSHTDLKNSPLSTSIQTQFKNHNFHSAISTLQSATKPLDTQSHIPTKFKQIFNTNTHDKKIVLAVRKIMTALTSTLDSIFSQRLSSVTNLLTSLMTSIIESLRILLVSLHNQHTKDDKKLLELANKALTDIKKCQPQTHVGLYSISAALLTLISLIFPALIILKNSICNHAYKVYHNQRELVQRKPSKSNLSPIVLKKNRNKQTIVRRDSDTSNEHGFTNQNIPKVHFVPNCDEKKPVVHAQTGLKM